jgi:lipoprotein NlpD
MPRAEAAAGQNVISPVSLRVATTCLLVLSLLGCVSHQTASERGVDETDQTRARGRPTVSEQSKPLRESDSPFRTVVPGDTLYSIAWEAGRDYREIAAWNRIPAPYTIKPGQQLRVLPPTKAEKNPATAVPPASVERSGTVATTPHPKASTTSKATKLPTAPAHVATPQAKPGHIAGGATSGSRSAGSGSSRKQGKAASTRTKNASMSSKSGKTVDGTPGFWTWPADGRELRRYGEGGAKGLDIIGTRGQPVRAAASGRVVYQGSGLRGYGRLIIIKHNDEFLSAYAHNDRIYVKEGDVVKRGQKIADMGSSGSDRVNLHFEIRRHGIPIDPLKYLPKH